MATLTNTSTESLDVPLYGICELSPGASVDIADDVAADFDGHPFLTAKTTTKTPAKTAVVTTEWTATDCN